MMHKSTLEMKVFWLRST